MGMPPPYGVAPPHMAPPYGRPPMMPPPPGMMMGSLPRPGMPHGMPPPPGVPPHMAGPPRPPGRPLFPAAGQPGQPPALFPAAAAAAAAGAQGQGPPAAAAPGAASGGPAAAAGAPGTAVAPGGFAAPAGPVPGTGPDGRPVAASTPLPADMTLVSGRAGKQMGWHPSHVRSLCSTPAALGTLPSFLPPFLCCSALVKRWSYSCTEAMLRHAVLRCAAQVWADEEFSPEERRARLPKYLKHSPAPAGSAPAPAAAQLQPQVRWQAKRG